MYSLYRIRSLAPLLFTAVAWSVVALLMVDLYTWNAHFCETDAQCTTSLKKKERERERKKSIFFPVLGNWVTVTSHRNFSTKWFLYLKRHKRERKAKMDNVFKSSVRMYFARPTLCLQSVRFFLWWVFNYCGGHVCVALASLASWLTLNLEPYNKSRTSNIEPMVPESPSETRFLALGHTANGTHGG